MSSNENRLAQQLVIYARELKTIYEEERAKRQELERANQRLRELDDMKTAFVELVSHELRTPVTIINGYLEVIAETLTPRLEQDEAEFFQLVNEQGRQLAELIEKITTFTNLTRREPLLQPHDPHSNTNLATLVRSELKNLEPAIRSLGLEVRLNLEENIPPANLEPARFKVIVTNLLNNAVKFNRQNGWLKVEMWVSQPEEDPGVPKVLELAVANSGAIIPPEKAGQIFEAFRQIQPTQTRNYSGLGLGLALVQHSVSSFKGETEFTSNSQEGTTFRVRLPYIAWQDPGLLSRRLQQLQSLNLRYAQDLRRLYEEEKEKNVILQRLKDDLDEKQSRLSLFLTKLLTAQEEERRRVSGDLHDGLAQTLTFAHQMLEMVEVEAPEAAGSKAFARSKETLKTARTEVRRLVAGLRPDLLDRFGLVPALREHFSNLAREENWEATFEVIGEFGEPGKSTLGPQIEENFYRIGQEALNNVRKHAKSRKVLLRLEKQQGCAILQVRDWGQGFQVPEKNPGKSGGTLDGKAGGGDNAGEFPGHFGLIGVEERMRLLKGTLDLQSEPGAGTILTVRVPLNE